MEIGGIHFNPESFKNMTKDIFKETYRGKLRYGSLEDAWQIIQNNIPDNQKTKQTNIKKPKTPKKN